MEQFNYKYIMNSYLYRMAPIIFNAFQMPEREKVAQLLDEFENQYSL